MKTKAIKIKVGAIFYSFFFGNEPRRLDPTSERVTGWIWGETDSRDHTIRVYDHPTDKDIIALTFYHELIHAILNEYHIKNMRDDDGNHSEDAVDLFAMALKGAMESLGFDVVSKLKSR